MKRNVIFSFLMAVLFSFVLGFSSCQSCKGDQKANDEQALNQPKAELIVENLISMDRQSMFLNYKNDYRWFETCIVLNNYLDVEEADGSVQAVSNIFQYVEDRGNNSFDTYVVLYTHTADTTATEVKAAFWVGDQLLNESEIKLSFKEAYDRLMQANLPKPHSKQVVLRRELGPKDANAQYIFGNTHSHVYVDAVTGDVKTTNPAYEGFEEDPNFGYAFNWLKADKGGALQGPLGEWP